MILDYYNSPELQLAWETDKQKGIKTFRGQNLEPADYQPDTKERAVISKVMRDFWYAREVQSSPYAEFNDESVLDRQTKDLKVFNAWTPQPSADPDLSWMSDAYRPIARNKVVSVAAHLTRALIFPEVVAVDEDSEEDKDAADVMRDLMHWVGEQSNYAKNFLYAVVDAAVLPAAIVHHEYAKVYRTQKTIQANGTWKEELVVDELLSGFRDTLLGADELFIADAFIDDIQKQPYLIWRKAIEYDTAYAKYHGNDGASNFDKYVKPGIQLLFDAQTTLFYRQFDENLRGNLVEEVHYWHRTLDLHLIFVNGVLISDPDQPNERQDKLYPFAKGGYEPFNHRFFWYCSLIKKLSKDEEVVNTLYRMVIDGTYLKIFKPTFVMGEESIDGSVIVPGNVIPLKSDTKVVPYDVGSDLKGGLDAIAKVESSISESAASGEQNSGNTPLGQQTAQEVATVEENARVLLGLFAKMISFLVRDWGKLIIGDIIQHLTVGEADEILGDEVGKLRFNKFLVHKNINGKKVSKHIKFDPNLQSKIGGMDKDEQGKPLNFDMMKDEGYAIKNGQLSNPDKEICLVDPDVFRKLKYMVMIRPESLTPPSETVERALKIELFDRLIKAGGDQDEALRLLLGSYDFTRNDPDKYLPKQQPMQQGNVMPQDPQNARGVLGNAMSMKKFANNPRQSAKTL